MYNNSLRQLSAELQADQLKALRSLDPVVFDQFPERQAAFYETGMYHFARLFEKYDFSYELFDTCLKLKYKDHRFSFVDDIPGAAFLDGARGQALEKCLFNREADHVVELSMLFSIFTNLLHGLLDKAPEMITRKEMAMLEKGMVKQSGSTHITDMPPCDTGSRPVTVLLFKVMAAIINTVTSYGVWKKDERIREEFTEAMKAAFLSEKNNRQYNDLFKIPADLSRAETDLYAKSCHWAWAGSLAPTCIHGWPRNMNKEGFRAFTYRLGVFGGWLDDMAGIAEDLRTGKWSSVLLEVYTLKTHLSMTDTPFPLLLQNSLADGSIQQHLIIKGISLYKDLLEQVAVFPGPTQFLSESIIDDVQTFLWEPGKVAELELMYEK